MYIFCRWLHLVSLVATVGDQYPVTTSATCGLSTVGLSDLALTRQQWLGGAHLRQRYADTERVAVTGRGAEEEGGTGPVNSTSFLLDADLCATALQLVRVLC
jgi:hypothetical protein